MAEKNNTTDIAAALATPEGQKAISEAASAAAAKAVADLMAGKAGVLPVDSSTRELFSQFALTVAEMGHQGSGRPRPVSPETMAKRAKAAAAMEDLLDQVHANCKRARETGDTKLAEHWTPHYRVTGKIFFKEHLIDPFQRPQRRGDRPSPTVIAWSGPPNHCLHPKNGIARRLTELFRESVGSAPLLKATSYRDATGKAGQVAPDNRPYFLTVGGQVVKGSPPPNATVLNMDDDDDLPQIHDRNEVDPNADFVRILGTVADPARQGAQAARQPNAAELSNA